MYPLRSKKFKPEEYEIDISNHVLIKGGSLNALKMTKRLFYNYLKKTMGVVLPIKINDYLMLNIKLLIDLAESGN